jgi:hypothetical protein
LTSPSTLKHSDQPLLKSNTQVLPFDNPAECRVFLDQNLPICYNTVMKTKINEILQWSGAVFIIAGHSLNAMGPEAYPYNILAFFVGTILFMIWTIRVANKPQFMVNVVALAIGASGLFKAFG